MIHYFSHILVDKSHCSNRDVIYSEAGKNRTMYIAKSISKPVNIISLANPRNKGYFKNEIVNYDKLINVLYLASFNILGLKYFFYLINIFIYLIKSTKKDDTILLYNAYPYHVIPVFLIKPFYKYNVILEIEELYRFYPYNFLKKLLFNLCETVALVYSDKFILVNSNLVNYIDKSKKYLVNFGYGDIYLPDIMNVKRKTPKIIYSGRIDFEGGVEILLKSLEYIETKCEVYITGSGPLEEHVANFKPANTKVNYFYLGFLGYSEYKKLLENADICINPIRSNNMFSNVSFPSKVLQYLKFGNLTISSEFSGLTDLDRKLRQYVITYKDDNPKELAKLINTYLSIKYEKKEIIDSINDFFREQMLDIKMFFD